MPFVSELIGKPVADVDSERVGHLEDLIASIRTDVPYPQVVAIVVKRPGGTLAIPMTDVAVLIAPAIPLTRRIKDVAPYQRGENDLCLTQDVLDKQIIDTDGMRVVRVNDLELARVNNHFFVVNVDIGGLGLARRLGVARVAQRLANGVGKELHPGIISWSEVELLPGNQPMRLKVPGKKITDLHPADLAEIISDLTRNESAQFLQTLDVKTLADTLEEVEPEFQASLVETMPDEKVADVLEEMAPDEAADLLAEMPEDRSKELLNMMEKDEAADVRKLLTYPDNSAGGIMNTEYIAVRLTITATQVVQVLRDHRDETENIFYIYVTDEENRLVGTFSLRDLVLAKPNALVSDFMHKRVASVNLLDSQDQAAQAISKYNLVALPVVDDQNRLHGVVTADDALDKLIPTAWKKRLPRLYR